LVHPNCFLFLKVRRLKINILQVSKLWQTIWDKDYNCIVIAIWNVMNVEKKIKSYKYLVIILLFLSFKKICISTPNASKAIKIVQLGFEMKGVIVWFRLINQFVIWSSSSLIIVLLSLGLKTKILVLHLMHSKPQKSLKLVLKWVRYVLMKWKGSLYDLG